MSGERLKHGLLHPVDLMERIGIMRGARVRALGVPQPYVSALQGAVGRGGRVATEGGHPCDVALVWQDEEAGDRLGEILGLALEGLTPEGALWVFAVKGGRKGPVPGSMTVGDISKRLEPHGMVPSSTVSVGPGRYGMRFVRRPPVAS